MPYEEENNAVNKEDEIECTGCGYRYETAKRKDDCFHRHVL